MFSKRKGWMNNKLIIFLIALFIFGCEDQKADMIIHNGVIYTMNDLNPITEAVAVGDGKIIALGKYRDLVKKLVHPAGTHLFGRLNLFGLPF